LLPHVWIVAYNTWKQEFRADDEAKITEGDGCWIGVL